MKQYINVPVRMRDGVCLSTDIRLPDQGGPFPTLVKRTPYGHVDPASYRSYLDAGFAMVTQDCRGRFDSEGRFVPFVDEAADGVDTLSWVRAQPWCDGRIGMIGGSYEGTTQLAPAWEQPAGLRAITPFVMGRDPFKDMIYQNGVFNLSLAVGWGLGVSAHTPQLTTYTDWQRVYRHLPLMTIDEAAGFDVPYFREWLSHPIYDAYWAAISVEAHYAQYNLPVLHRGGWYDQYGEGVVRNFKGMRAHGGPLARHQQLVMGPWGHDPNTRALGQLDFGPRAVIDLDSLERRWLDRWVCDEENGVEHEAPVRIFIMSTNVWRDEWEWPLARAREEAWYLASGGHANSLFGDGTLSDMPVDGAETDGYLYNPENPVPAFDGSPQDHQPIERRDDVLVFTGPELREPLEVTGDIKAVLYASSDAPDTDFVARLCDVHPDGRSINICDGIVRARYREGLHQEVLMTPGTICEFDITMGVTANTFLPGHRLRLEVTSSCFPRFNRNLNTSEPIATGTRLQCARQTIYHSRAYPSRVLLPVVSSEAVG